MLLTMDASSRPAVYLVAVEDIAQSPLIRGQVINLLKTMAALGAPQPLALVALYPLINWWRNRARLAALRTELAESGITLRTYPVAFMTRYFYMPRSWLALFRIQAWVAALWISWRLRPALVHCRSYPATLVGAAIKRLTGCRLIFDARALYPEEGVVREDGGKTVMLSEADFAAWKRIEADLMAQADAIAAISQPMADILADQYPGGRSRLIVAPTCTPAPPLADLDVWRQSVRDELNLADRLVVAYSGSWFEPGPAIALFRRLQAALPGAPWEFLLLISSRGGGDAADRREGIAEAVRRGLEPGAGCRVISAPQGQVLRYLAAADLAAQPVAPPARASVDPRYESMARTVLSVKFAEYLAAGLPVIISRWHGAAADIVTAQDLGLVYDRAAPAAMTHWLTAWQSARASYRSRSWRYACDHFDTGVVAAQYLDLYHRLSGKASA
jgi:glycosyltransferase involved in cell wall biosynthesis